MTRLAAVDCGTNSIRLLICDSTDGKIKVRLPSFSGHPICTDLVSVGEDVHCESTAQEVHAGVPA